MKARPVDPRDIDLEWTSTTYRVYFWTADGTVSEEHEITGVLDVRQVIRWADARADGRTTEIFVRHDHDAQRGLIRLAGARPDVR